MELKRKLQFLWIEMEYWHLLVLFAVWLIFLIFIWPVLNGSFWATAIFFTVLTMMLTGAVLRMLLLFLLLLQFVYKKAIGVIYFLVLFPTALLVTLFYRWLRPMDIWHFLDNFTIILFSAYFFTRFLTESTKDEEI